MTETQTVDLAAWLTQIWDEEEAAYRETAGDEAYQEWAKTSPDLNDGWMVAEALHGLARIAADRKILEWCTEREQIYVGTVSDDPSDPKNYVPGGLKHPADSVVVRLLASPYKGREGWRENWADE